MFELEVTGGGESLDVRFEGQGRIQGYSEAVDFGDREKCDFIYFDKIDQVIMPRIDNDIKLDFKDVLLRPKRSTLKSRSEVSAFYIHCFFIFLKT
ncbi:unnamed protein product [Ranitomeya imitator]|uniref:Uncharacterized protein n=1 Tax=Ranitomeya imitator TaxID=111125 RepID=A0ABN9ML53_9NEOB|nr:unnamed protein product [Ranitomeya imitator]